MGDSVTDPQQTLDTTGRLAVEASLPAADPVWRQGTLAPPAPLFLDSGMEVYGSGRVKVSGRWERPTLHCHASGGGFYVGWRRGLVPDECFAGAKFRTLGQTFLFGRGSEWDKGPRVGGWATVRRLRIQAIFRKHYSEPWRQVLGGISGLDRVQAAGFGPNPCPYVLWVGDGFLRLYLRTNDGQQRLVQWPFDCNQTTLPVGIDVDLEALYGPGTRLMGNTLWPFGLGFCPPYCNDRGYWGTSGAGGVGHDPADVSIDKFDVFVNDDGPNNPLCRLHGGRVPTYDGGPSLPLVSAGTRGVAGRHLLCVHRSQGLPDTAGGVRVRDLRIVGRPDNPVVSIGGGLGLDLTMSDVYVEGGSRGVQTTGLTVAYPVTIRDCTFTHQQDVQFWMNRASGLTLERNQTNYPGRCVAELVECKAWVRGELMLSPAADPREIFSQYGGDVCYERITSDREWEPYSDCFVRFRPWAYADHHAGLVEVRGCLAPHAPAALVTPKPPQYAGIPYTVVVDGATVASA